MLTYRTGAAGTSSAAKSMARHLLTPTLPVPQANLSAYYQRGLPPALDSEAYETTVPEVRFDIDPRMVTLLGLPFGRVLSAAEVANILAGNRADGLPVKGKQTQGTKEPLAQELGISGSRLPLPNEVERVLLGCRADDGTALPADRAPMLRSRFLKILGLKNVAVNGHISSELIKKALADVNERRFLNAVTNRRPRVAFIDLCWSADKSVSVAWAMAPTEAERHLIVDAHKHAVAQVMSHVEKTIGLVRRGKAGCHGYVAGSMAWVSFDHYTSRPVVEIAKQDQETGEMYTECVGFKIAGDPQIHSHVIAMAAVLPDAGGDGGLPDKGEDGAHSLDLRLLKGRIHEFGRLYQGFVAENLRRLGIDVGLDMATGAARITAIPENVRAAFSKRTRTGTEMAKAYAREQSVDWDSLDENRKVGLMKQGVQGDPRQAKTDDLSDWASWYRQANELGWVPQSVLRLDAPIPLADRGLRIDHAYNVGLELLEEKLLRQAVIDEGTLRSAAASGLVAAGLQSPAEVDLVVEEFFTRGVRQDGCITQLLRGFGVGAQGNEFMRVTTRLHADREAELISLVRAAANDKSAALDPGLLDDAVRQYGVDFEATEHGRTQRAMMNRLALGGRFSAAIGVAGSGKSFIIAPLILGWRGRSVWGCAISWRQSADLFSAGIAEDHCLALSVFVDRLKAGKLQIDKNSVLVIDELGTVGTKLLLEIMRLQQIHHFQIVGIGDPRQCQSLEAGPVIELLKMALGTDAIPEILTTVRQTNERERKTSLLFRQGRAAEALAVKCEDKTARSIAGDYGQVCNGIAELWQERRTNNAQNKSWTISVSAPTNSDARAIASAIRTQRQATGELGPNKWNIAACDPQGVEFDLNIAIGDRLRLFKRTNGACQDRSRGLLGSNGSIVEMVGVNEQGISLRNKMGRVGHVAWDTLRAPSGRILLTYGDVLTIDSCQGLTTTEHISAMPKGSSSVNAFKAYTASSRHRETTFIITSEGAERREIAARRSMGDTRRVREADIWENVARNLSRVPEQESASLFLLRTRQIRREASVSMQIGLQRLEQLHSGRRPASLSSCFRQRRVSQSLRLFAAHLSGWMEQVTRFVERLQISRQDPRIGAAVVSEEYRSDLAPSGPKAMKRFNRSWKPAYRL